MSVGRTMRIGAATAGLATVATAAVALAAGPTIKVGVKPNTAGAKSALSVSATGPFGQSGLPNSLKLTAQKGFQSSAKSVSALCNAGKVPAAGSTGCPSASKVGSGKAVASFAMQKQTLALTMYLGKPRHTGDIASIVLSGHNAVLGTLNVVGRLFKTNSGTIEILFSKLIAGGLPATLKSISFSAHAVNGKYSLITNPPSCKGGHWSGSFLLAFSGGTVSQQTAIPCSK